MIRIAAVRALLLDDIACLKPGDGSSSLATDRLARARLRAGLLVALDWIAILVLFLWRPEGRFLTLEGSEQGIFTFAVLAVATHAGYRLAQIETLGAVGRALDELPDETTVEERPDAAR